MNIIILLRTQILNIIVLSFLLVYDKYCHRVQNTKNNFTIFGVSALMYSIFGFITEITVNMSGFPKMINNILHIIYYFFIITFTLAYFDYILSHVATKRVRNKLVLVARIICAISFISLFFFDIDYINGKGTNYSMSVGVSICYLCGFLILVVSDALMIIYRKVVPRYVLISLLPISMLGIGLLVMQVVIPEFLFSESVATMITIGAFLAVENPVIRIPERALMDIDSGAYNKNSYELDVKALAEEYDGSEDTISCIMFDLNNLKYVNDHFGHIEGDNMIRQAANLIMSNINAKVYRIGGDEFITFCKDIDEQSIINSINNIRNGCKKLSNDFSGSFSIAIGYAVKRPGETLQNAVLRADKNMYVDKKIAKGI